jgi:hypothetical protein
MANPFHFLTADWQWVLVIAVMMIGLLVDARRRRKIQTLKKVISHMSQGVCMFGLRNARHPLQSAISKNVQPFPDCS